MSVYWRPVAPKEGNALEGQSSFMNLLREAFGPHEGPVILEQSNVLSLRAMGITIRSMSISSLGQKSNDFFTLADAVEIHGAVEVWGEC